MPGPSSLTLTALPCNTSSTLVAAHLVAFSTRLPSARSSCDRRPITLLPRPDTVTVFAPRWPYRSATSVARISRSTSVVNGVGCQIDEFRGESGQMVGLGQGGIDQVVALLPREPAPLEAEDFEVDLECGYRRAELVTRIGYQALLLLPRGHLGGEHR